MDLVTQVQILEEVVFHTSLGKRNASNYSHSNLFSLSMATSLEKNKQKKKKKKKTTNSNLLNSALKIDLVSNPIHKVLIYKILKEKSNRKFAILIA